MNWEDLRYVLALTREGLLNRAADQLGVSHTTVGRRVRALEAELGVRLFDRTPDGLTPTAAGHDIAAVAAEVEAQVLALEARVLGRDAKLRGELRVATMDLLLRRYHGAFEGFLGRYPSVELTVVSNDRALSLTRREADVALRLTNAPPQHLVGRRIDRVAFAVFASAELAERCGPDAPYDAYPWLHWDKRLNMRWLDVWLAQNAPNATVALRLDASTLSLHEAIAASLGVHFLACDEGDADPRLRRLGPPDPAFSRDVWLLTLPELRSTLRVRAFMDHMAERIAARPAP